MLSNSQILSQMVSQMTLCAHSISKMQHRVPVLSLFLQMRVRVPCQAGPQTPPILESGHPAATLFPASHPAPPSIYPLNPPTTPFPGGELTLPLANWIRADPWRCGTMLLSAKCKGWARFEGHQAFWGLQMTQRLGAMERHTQAQPWDPPARPVSRAPLAISWGFLSLCLLHAYFS